MESTLAIEHSQPYGAADAPGAAASPGQSGGQPEVSFHDVLSALNPLQYVPVVGNIYRAVTGDSPPEGVRMVGCAIFSALTGGPVGLAIYAGITAAEKLTGFDPDHIAHEVLASVGLADETPATAVATGSGRRDAEPAQPGAVIAAYTRTQQIDCMSGARA